jgi:hypothetical protein
MDELVHLPQQPQRERGHVVSGDLHLPSVRGGAGDPDLLFIHAREVAQRLLPHLARTLKLSECPDWANDRH